MGGSAGALTGRQILHPCLIKVWPCMVPAFECHMELSAILHACRGAEGHQCAMEAD